MAYWDVKQSPRPEDGFSCYRDAGRVENLSDTRRDVRPAFVRSLSGL
jgi:hypothetical protein